MSKLDSEFTIDCGLFSGFIDLTGKGRFSKKSIFGQRCGTEDQYRAKQQGRS
jgi:hypothetical protein